MPIFSMPVCGARWRGAVADVAKPAAASSHASLLPETSATSPACAGHGSQASRVHTIEQKGTPAHARQFKRLEAASTGAVLFSGIDKAAS